MFLVKLVDQLHSSLVCFAVKYFLKNVFFIFRGNYISPHELPTFAQSPHKIEHSTTKDNHFPPFRQLKGLKQMVNESNDHHMLFYPHFLHNFPI
jgi:hypothetical protein